MGASFGILVGGLVGGALVGECVILTLPQILNGMTLEVSFKLLALDALVFTITPA